QKGANHGGTIRADMTPRKKIPRVPAMRADRCRSFRTWLALMAVFMAPLALGFCLESRWLSQAGFIVLALFILALWGYEWQGLHRRREVRENMRRILEERKEK